MTDIHRSPNRGRRQADSPAAPARGKAARQPRPAAVPPPDARPANSVLARLAALKTAPVADLKAKWRELFETEPPPYNRRFLEHRLAYRIQELAYGGLKPETLERLRALGEQFDGGKVDIRKRRSDRDRPIAGTRLIREYQGVEHYVTVRDDGYEYQGRPY